MSLHSHFNRSLLRALAIASFALVAVAPSVAQQRRPISTPLDSFVFEGGGGFTAPAGGTSNVIDYGYNLMGGVGFKESRYFSTIAEFSYNHNSLTQSELNRQVVPDGHRVILAVTLEQKFNLSAGPTHAYLIGGGGYYHQRTTYTEPGAPLQCDPFSGFCIGGGDIILGQFSTDQAGFNAGAGIEHRFTPYSNAKLFVESRYTYLDTPAHLSTPGRATQIIPVTIGLRF